MKEKDYSIEDINKKMTELKKERDRAKTMQRQGDVNRINDEISKLRAKQLKIRDQEQSKAIKSDRKSLVKNPEKKSESKSESKSNSNFKTSFGQLDLPEKIKIRRVFQRIAGDGSTKYSNIEDWYNKEGRKDYKFKK